MNQRGQAIVEYILVLVVVVALIIGALSQLNEGFRQYTENLFGGYIECLIETGELPTLHSANPGTTECTPPEFTAEIEPHDPSEGGGGGGDGTGGGGDGTGGGSSGSKANKDRDGDKSS